MELTTNNEAETLQLAGKIAQLTRPGDILALEGDLGAGKTTFTQGFCQALKVSDYVTSPTFTLINIYNGQLPIYHIDLYRLNDPQDALDIGIESYLPSADGITLVEWANKFPSILPDALLSIKISYENETIRHFSIQYIGCKRPDFENQLLALSA